MNDIGDIQQILNTTKEVPRILLTQYRSSSVETLKCGIVGSVKFEVFIACLDEMFMRLRRKPSEGINSMERTEILDILCSFLKTPDTNVLRPVKTIIDQKTGLRKPFPFDLRLFILQYIKNYPLKEFKSVLTQLRNNLVMKR